MEDIEQLALQTYGLNMEYLKNTHRKLHSLMEEFEAALQNGEYSQKFDLEYVNGGFDIKEINSGTYMYNQDSAQFVTETLKQVNFEKESSCIITAPIDDINDLDTSKYKKEMEMRIFVLAKYIASQDIESTDMKEVQKYIFSGVGLGLHIEPIDRKIKASHYLIIEDHIEIFKLSLFTTKYYELAKKATLYFSVYEDTETFTKTYQNFLQQGYMYNHRLKYTHLSTHSNVKLKHLLVLMSNLSFISFHYQLRLAHFLSPLLCMKKEYGLTNIFKQPNDSLFRDKPVLILAAGPSLERSIRWVQENQDKFIIFAISTVLHLLDSYAIKPDIVASIDSEELVQDYFTGYKNKDHLSKAVFVFSSFTYEGILETVPKNNRFVFDISLEFNSPDTAFGFSCVGSFSYMYALSLGASSVYTLGLDLAVDQETGVDHISGYNRETKTLNMDIDSLSSNITSRDTPIKIAGNFQDEIYTTPMFKMSIDAINEYAIPLKKSHQNGYNLSNGAKVAGTQALRIEDVQIEKLVNLDKNSFHINLKNFLKENTNESFTIEELEKITKYKTIIGKTKKLILKYSKLSSSSNSDVYMQNLITIARDVMSVELENGNNIAKIYQKYFEYFLRIVYDFFNTKGLKNKGKHIKEIDKIFVEGLEDINKQLEDVLA